MADIRKKVERGTDTIKKAAGSPTGRHLREVAGRVLEVVVKTRPKTASEWMKLFERYLPPGFIDDLARGRLSITEALVRAALESRMTPDMRLESLACTPSGISVKVRYAGKGARPTLLYSGCVKIVEMNISVQKQFVVVDVLDERLSGDSMAGEIVAATVSAVLTLVYGSIVATTIPKLDIPNVKITPVSGHSGRFKADLSRLSVIVNLRKPVLFGRSPLHVIEMPGCEHAMGKILLRGRIPPFVA